jgi:hypothetical protein
MSNGDPTPPPAGGQMPHSPDETPAVPDVPAPDQQNYDVGTETDQQPGS